MNRITDRVSEALRRGEKAAAVKNLLARVDDWKGHHLATFGELALADVFMVTRASVDREYYIFLFEKIMLCCREDLSLNNRSRVGKEISAPKRQLTSNGATSLQDATQLKQRNTPLHLTGRVFLSNVTQAVGKTRKSAGMRILSPIKGLLIIDVYSLPPVPGSSVQCSLEVWWRGFDDLDFLTLRCRNEEQMEEWKEQFNRLIDISTQKRANNRATPFPAASIAPW